MASNILDRWGVGGAIQSASLIEASDRLERFVAARWPQARQHKEVPVFSRIGNQRASGRIDLLLETDDGFVIVDHKTFPGAPDTWTEKAQEFTPQLRLYGRMVTQATRKPVRAAFIHMPVVGVVIEVHSA
jgi:ATP-dependent exoDNAse (exonuclease V) beta subunit